MVSGGRVSVVVLAAALLGGCGAGPVSRAQLEAAVSQTFGNLYVVQQQRLGATVGHDVGASASCDKGGPTVTDQGPGEDWSCQVSWVAADGSLQQVDYELQVKPDACYQASGPSGVVGSPQLATKDGNADNPLYEFDGCTRAI